MTQAFVVTSTTFDWSCSEVTLGVFTSADKAIDYCLSRAKKLGYKRLGDPGPIDRWIGYDGDGYPVIFGIVGPFDLDKGEE